MIFTSNNKKLLIVYLLLSLTVSFLLLHISQATTMNNNYEGSYILQSISDENHVSLTIPSGSEFRMDLTKDDEDTSDNDVYKFGFKMGNVLRSKMVITTTDPSLSTTDTIQLSGVSSTRMLPPPEINVIERGVTNILRSATSIQYQDLEHNIISIDGVDGSFQCQRIIT